MEKIYQVSRKGDGICGGVVVGESGIVREAAPIFGVGRKGVLWWWFRKVLERRGYRVELVWRGEAKEGRG